MSAPARNSRYSFLWRFIRLATRRLDSAVTHRKAHRSGQTLVEFALILPLLLTVTVGVVDLGRAVATYNLVSESARAGARAGRIAPNQTAINAAVMNELGPLAPAPTISYGVCTTNCTAAGSESGEPFVRVNVSTTFQPVFGLVIGLTPFQLAASSQQYLNNVSAAAGGPTPIIWTPVATPNQTAIADTTATAIAGATLTAIAETTATATQAPTIVIPTATPTPEGRWVAPSKYVPNSDEASNYQILVQCLASGKATSTQITWKSQENTTLYFWLRPTSATGSPTELEMTTYGQSGSTVSGLSLQQPVLANVQYTLWVYNAGSGSAKKYDATVSDFTVSCP